MKVHFVLVWRLVRSRWRGVAQLPVWMVEIRYREKLSDSASDWAIAIWIERRWIVDAMATPVVAGDT